MTVIHRLDRKRGLDLFLHTPGGDGPATESLVDYLRKMFGRDIRAIVPQLAMSAGTMIACACREIVMGKHSNLGPVDAQIRGLPAYGILEEFNKAHVEIKRDPSKVAVWQPIIAKYPSTLIGECEKAIEWSEQLVKDWLCSNMLRDRADKEQRAADIVRELTAPEKIPFHGKHFHIEQLSEMGLHVVALEKDDRLQELVLSVHHACKLTLSSTPACKIIENHLGVAHIVTLSKQAS